MGESFDLHRTQFWNWEDICSVIMLKIAKYHRSKQMAALAQVQPDCCTLTFFHGVTFRDRECRIRTYNSPTNFATSRTPTPWAALL